MKSVFGIALRRDNLNGKNNIRPLCHCNYGGIHLNNIGSQVPTETFILPLSSLS